MTHPVWRRSLHPPSRPPLTRNEPELLWTLRDPRTRRIVVRCAVCAAGDAFELLVDGTEGELRWGYHTLDAAKMGATRLRERLLSSGWTEPEQHGG